MSHNPNLPEQRFIINFSNRINSVSLRYEDIKSVTSEKLEQVADVEFVELGFDNQSQLEELVSFLGNFKNLRYLSFTNNGYFSKESSNEIIIPNEVSRFDKIIGVKFAGKWKVNFQKSFETLKKLPVLSYYLFQSFNDELPKELLTVKVKGISLHSEKKTDMPMWIADLKSLETLSINMVLYAPREVRYADYNKILSNISTLTDLKSLYVGSFYNVDSTITKIKIPSLEELSISGGEIKKQAAFFEFVGNLTDLKTLSLEGVKYDTLKRDLLKLKKLKSLNLSGTYKQDLMIDFELKELKSLISIRLRNFSSLLNLNTFPSKTQSLVLSGNKFNHFPVGISKLKELKRLELAYNSIDSLPQSIGNLGNLSYLGLESNQLKYLPSNLGKLNQLKVILLKANPLKLLPANIGSLSNLEKLDVSFCDLTELPSTFSQLIALKKLDASFNFLSVLPNDFCKLKSLDSLSLAKNAITGLPTEIGQLENLRYLNLVSNNLKKLPENFGKLKQLEELNLAGNDLVELPASFKELSSIQTLYLSSSQKKSEGKAKDSLREIYRKDSPYAASEGGVNRFSVLPVNLSQWNKLKKINLDNLTSLGNDALLALQTISSKGYSVEFENGNITQLPKDGWEKFKVGVLNLRNNKIEELPKDIVNAPFLKSYNFNQNRLPSKPINQNSYAANKYEKLLWFKEFGFIKDNELPRVDSMVLALVEKSSSHYYRKEFGQSVLYANQAISINKDLALSKIFKTNLGEAYYETGYYKEAIELLTAAIKNDTSGNVRIMNSVVPDFEFRAKSYLKLGDTLNAIDDYKTLAANHWSDTWAEVGILYSQINNRTESKNAFAKAVKEYQDYITFSKKQKNNVELKQLSLLEALIISEDFNAAEKYAEEIKLEIKNKENSLLLLYLTACVKVGLNKEKEIDFGALNETILAGKKQINSWGYELFYKWLRITRIDKSKSALIRMLTDSIRADYN